MFAFIKWFLFACFLGFVSLPLSWRLFTKLPSRGHYLSKALGLLIWGFLYWMAVSLGIMSNHLSSTISMLFVVIGINVWIGTRVGWKTLWEWFKENIKSILVAEGIYFVFFAFWTIVRAANPDIIHTEKFMEMAFINGILRSENFPPMDPWLSGYGISYYYFGYVLSAMLIRITNVASSVGYNLVSSFWFGLSALGAYGLMSDLIYLTKKEKPNDATDKLKENPKKIEWVALLAPIMLLIVSNWFGALDVAHSRGLSWDVNTNGELNSAFWTDFNIPELQNPPFESSWIPNRGGWSWWQASRVLRDETLTGNSIEVIDEFPQFTFLLSDIHPHMLGIPFVILLIAQALNAINGGFENKWHEEQDNKRYDLLAVFLSVLSLGGIAFLNTWDFPFYLVLLATCLVYRRYQKNGWKIQRIFEFFTITIIGGLSSVALYLPFYLSFASQAGGILPSLAFFTPGTNFWVMFGPLLVPIMLYLVYSFVKKNAYKNAGLAIVLTLGLFVVLFSVSWGLAWIANGNPSNAFLLGLQGASNSRELLVESILKRLKAPGTAITLFLIFVFSLSLLLTRVKEKEINKPEAVGIESEKGKKSNIQIFVLFLVILGGLLLIAPEFIYLRDQFNWRMNTIFKFYFQAWILWSIASSYAVITLFRKQKTNKRYNAVAIFLLVALGILTFAISLNERTEFTKSFGVLKADWLVLAIGVIFFIWIIWSIIKKQYPLVLAILSVVAILGGLVYPVLEIWNKTNGFQGQTTLTLDGKRVFWESYPDAMRAVEWLETASVGVMAEAVAEQGGSYTTYNLISTFSGMPSVLGWVGHEYQWRGGGSEVGSRQQDLRELYTAKSEEKLNEVINRYNIRYIVLGDYEREVYRVMDPMFTQVYEPVFSSGKVIIYEVRP